MCWWLLKAALFGFWGSLALASVGLAQVRAVASFDRTNAEAGDTVVLRIQVAGLQVPPQRVDLSAWLQVLSADDIRPLSSWRRIGEYWVQTMAIVLLDTGRIVLPPLAVLLHVGNAVLTNSMEIRVVAPDVPADLNAMAPIRDIRRQSRGGYAYWLAIAAALTLATLWWVWRKYRQRSTRVLTALPEQPRPSPCDIAQQKLTVLAEQKPWMQPDRIEMYYTDLSWIVREFLEGQYGFLALEQTTAEIAQNLSQTGLPEHLRLDAQRLLERADWVKFAQGRPATEEHERWLQTAKRICQKFSSAPNSANSPDAQPRTI
ncbi:MAG: hypothetical protein NZM43_13125 [Saprospiraceae bacterium]|nr:hypothetical protein [Saprospiraceae bacterium]MDW8485256.1 hypothetical protein [Saprospiraceae bacterium]